MQIIALQDYTDKYVSLYQGEIRIIPKTMALKLIEEGIVAEHNESNTSGSSGYTIIEKSVQLFKVTINADQQVDTYYYYDNNTQNALYNGLPVEEPINIIYDGVKYKNIPISGNVCGAPFDYPGYDFSTYPFTINFYKGTNDNKDYYSLLTSTPGEHTLIIQQNQDTIDITEDFEAAVEKVNIKNSNVFEFNVYLDSNETNIVNWDSTVLTVIKAFSEGKEIMANIFVPGYSNNYISSPNYPKVKLSKFYEGSQYSSYLFYFFNGTAWKKLSLSTPNYISISTINNS